MNTVMKIILSTVFLAAVLVAAPVVAQKGSYIKTKTRTITAQKITADSQGVLTYKKGQISQKIKPSAYLYARIPMPKKIRDASSKYKAKKYSEASSQFSKCYNEYKYLGWDVFCIYYDAMALDKLGKKSEAIVKIKLLEKIPLDRKKVKMYFEAKKNLATLYISMDQFNDASTILTQLGMSNNDSIAAFANNANGDILAKQGKKKDALLMYLRTVLLFPKTNKKERPAALVKTAKILKADKNNKYLDFEKILKTDYPGSKYISEL